MTDKETGEMVDLTNETKLKPCPFCGGEAHFTWNSYRQTYRCECISEACPMRPYTPQYDRREAAVAAWNKRAEP